MTEARAQSAQPAPAEMTANARGVSSALSSMGDDALEARNIPGGKPLSLAAFATHPSLKTRCLVTAHAEPFGPRKTERRRL
jgi:hypothetical protein